MLNIITHKITAAKAKPIQKPWIFKLYLKARVYPKGIDINQYATKFDINTTFVFFMPLNIPESATCNPSKIWNTASMYNIGTEIFIRLLSLVNSLTKNSGNVAKMIALQAIKPTDNTMPTNEYFFKSGMFCAPFANPTFTAIAFEIARGTINETVVSVQTKF